jgi:atypical dual specificity phosphatase
VGFVVQNRSHYVSSDSHLQFRKLDAFVQQHRGDLMQLLARDPLFPERYILFGEWLAATHSIPYTRLESLFYVFSMYDRETHRFLDRRAMELLMRDIDIPLARLLWRGAELPAKAELIAMVQQPSAYYDGRVEGVYITWEKNGAVKERAKVVRSDFICGNEHWTRGPLRLNEVVPKTA